MNKIQKEEWAAVFFSFIYYFCILSAYYIMRPLRDQIAAQVGSINLPLYFAATLIMTLILTPIFSWSVSKFSRPVIMPFVYLFFIACQMTITALFHYNLLSTYILGLVFFVFVSVFNLFAVSIFWSFMADIWNDIQARRLYPVIALGGTFGAISGPIFTHSLVEVLGRSSLFLMSAIFLIVAIFCILLLGKWADRFGTNRNKKDNEAPLKGGMFDGLKLIFSNAFIASMSVIMIMNDAVGTIAYVLVTDYSGSAYIDDAISQIRFAATMDFLANAFQIFVQLTVTRWLLIRYGAGAVFIVCSSVVVFLCLGMSIIKDPLMSVFGNIPFVALVLIISRGLSYSMIQPARETLYTLVSRQLRYKGKNAIDTVVWRAGDVLSLLMINGLKFLGFTPALFGLIAATFAALSGIMGFKLSSKAEKGKFL